MCAFLVFECKVVFLQEFHPTGLTIYKFGLGRKILESSMIGIDDKIGVVEIVPLYFESVYHSQQFLLMGRIVMLGRVEFS